MGVLKAFAYCDARWKESKWLRPMGMPLRVINSVRSNCRKISSLEKLLLFLNVEYYTFPTLLSSTAEACLSPSLTSCTNASSSETCPYQG